MLVKRLSTHRRADGDTAPCPVGGRGTAMPPTGREGHRQVSAGLRGPQVGGPWLVKGRWIPRERIHGARSVWGNTGLDGPPPPPFARADASLRYHPLRGFGRKPKSKA